MESQSDKSRCAHIHISYLNYKRNVYIVASCCMHRKSTVCGDARAPVLPSSGIPCQCDFGTVIGITPLMTLMDGRPKKSENRCLLRSEIVPGGQMALERASGGDPGESWISPETSSVKYNTN